jgi:PKD repeat protein
MDEKYEYHLVFPEDGEQSHYIVERYDTSQNGEIILTYWTNTNTLEVETINLKKLTIDCKKIYYEESMKVFKYDPYTDAKYYKDYFVDRDLLVVNVQTDELIEELRFSLAPQPVEVYVNNEEWWKSGTNYNFEEGGTIVLTHVPKGVTEVKLYFKEKFSPTAKFSMTPSPTDQKDIYGLNQELSFDATKSTDTDGTIEEYNWDFGDENTGSGVEVTHKYTKLGEYTINLIVIDNDGLESSTSKTIFIIRSVNDFDSDRMPDVWEATYQLDYTTDDSAGDLDNDRLSNLEEFQNGTHPKREDSDNDGYSDYDEIVKYNTNASDPNDKPTTKAAAEEDDFDDLLPYIAIAVILIILIIIILLLIRKRKKKEEEEPEAPEDIIEPGEGGEVPPEMEAQGPGMVQEPAPAPGQMPMDMQMELGMQMPLPPPVALDEYQYAEEESTEGSIEGVPDEMPPLYKTEPELPPSEELDLGDLDFVGAPEEGLAGMEEGLPPEEDLTEVPLDEEAPPEEEGPPISDQDEEPKPEAEGEGEEPEIKPEPIVKKPMGKKTRKTKIKMKGKRMVKKEEVEEKEKSEEPEEPEEEEEPEVPKKSRKSKRSRKLKEPEEEEEPQGPEEEEEPGIEKPEEAPKGSIKEYVIKGALLFKDEKYTEAIIEWQKALDIEPNHPEIVESIKEAMAKLKEAKD